MLVITLVILYVPGDSLPYIHSQFSESHSKYYLSYLYKDFAEQKPDIFVYECVERYIDGLSTFSVEYGK